MNQVDMTHYAEFIPPGVSNRFEMVPNTRHRGGEDVVVLRQGDNQP